MSPIVEFCTREPNKEMSRKSLQHIIKYEYSPNTWGKTETSGNTQ